VPQAGFTLTMATSKKPAPKKKATPAKKAAPVKRAAPNKNPPAKKATTPKQERFVQEYIIDLNATQAAIRAGYSAKTANEQGARLLTNVSVRSEIDEALAARAKRTEIDADRVLLELRRLAFFDIRRIFNADGSLKRITDLDDDTAAAIMSVEMVEIGTDGQLAISKKYKASDKKGALELAMRHLGMLKDKLDLTGEVTVLVKDFTGKG